MDLVIFACSDSREFVILGHMDQAKIVFSLIDLSLIWLHVHRHFGLLLAARLAALDIHSLTHNLHNPGLKATHESGQNCIFAY